MRVFRFAALVLLAVSTLANSQAYPDKSKTIRFVVPFGPGSGADTITRAYVQAMTEQAGVKAIVENRPGAEAVIGVDYVRQAAPDGYTILFGNTSTHVLNYHVLPSLPYDPVKDFIPVAGIYSVELVLNAGPSTTFRSLDELVEAARANPGKYSLASMSTSTRLSGEMLAHLAKMELLSVPHKTSGDAVAALAGGHIDLLMADVTTGLPYYKSGKLRPLGVTGQNRLPALPNVPTIQEQGVKGYQFSAWHAFFSPAGTPPEVVDRLRGLLRDASRSKFVADALAINACDPLNMDTAQLNAQLKTDLASWGGLLKDMKKTAR